MWGEKRSNTKFNVTPESDVLADKSIRQRTAIYLAGPIFSLLLGIVLVSALLLYYGEDGLESWKAIDTSVLVLLSGLSILIGVFNLLPLLPLDGGRVLLLGLEAYRAKPLSDDAQTLLSHIGVAMVILLSLGAVFEAAKVLSWV